MHCRTRLAGWRRQRQAALQGKRQAHEAHPAKPTQDAWRAIVMSMRSDEEIKRSIAALLARKFEKSPKSMAWVLARYRDAEGVDDAAIARQLGVDEHRLHHLALCGRPREYLFAEDIESIAEHIGIEQLPLASLVR